MTILISEKLDFRDKNITRDKGLIHQEGIKVLNAYAPNMFELQNT